MLKMTSLISRCSNVARTLEAGGVFARTFSPMQVSVNQPRSLRFASTSSNNLSSKSPAESTVGGESPTVQVTENCAKRLMELLSKSPDAKNQFLRVSVEGGGCSGFQYKFEVDSKTQPDDKAFTNPKYESALVVVDSTSLEYLKGSTVDYHVELIRSAFRIVSNPKAEHGCSCGASFTVKFD